MYLIHPFVALLCGMIIPFFIITTRLLGRKIRPISKKLMQQYGRTFSIAEENLATLSLIKAYSREQYESARFQNGNETLFQLSSQYLKSQALLAPVTRFLAATTLIAILFFGGEYIMEGALSTSDIVSLMLYGMLLTRPLSSLADTYGQIQRAVAAGNRLMTVFETRTEEYFSGTILKHVKGEISLHNISFNYPGRKPLYTKLNLTVKPGETIAITGENGVGKSTIAHLLLRLHSPQNGQILIDGIDIQGVTLKSLRSQIGLVQQNVLLRNCSVLDNLLFGEQDADIEAVEKAAKGAQAYEFIQNLPQGFHTLIGDNGIKLSGGQKQRLSLARALLKQPAILILDEATAMFDPQGEEQFISENKTLLKEKTVIIITHRPATLALADRIYELKNMTLSLQK
jgi:ABC-type multidrug transport system fused ATPase/permease subunit